MSATDNMMRTIAKSLDNLLNGRRRPKPNGFVVLVFPVAAPEGKRVDYISNCERTEIVAALKEVIQRFERELH